MYDYKKLDNLKSQKRKLEFELTEERFHYESIPKRKALSASKARLCFVFAVICTGALLIQIIALILILSYTSMGNDPTLIIALFAILFPAAFFTLISFSIKIWREFFEYMGLLYGKKNKASNYGSSNYTDEARKSEAKIKHIKAKLIEIDTALSTNQSTQNTDMVDSHLSSIDSPIPLADDDLFLYALGHWGDEKENILANMQSDKYEQEAESLHSKIDEQKSIIISLAHRLSIINQDYQYVKSKLAVYIVSQILIILAQIFVYTSISSRLELAIIGAAYMIITTTYVLLTCKDKYMAYKVEYNPNNFREYAERHGIETVSTMHQRCIAKIDDYTNRLEYINMLLDYKHNILNMN